jgi:hypothetical protein
VNGWRHGWVFDRRLVLGGVVALVLVAAGVGGYAIAASRGVDVGSAELAATHSGEERGAAAGRRDGFARGFAATRDRAYESAYHDAYVSAFRNEFQNAGLSAPVKVKVRQP